MQQRGRSIEPRLGRLRAENREIHLAQSGVAWLVRLTARRRTCTVREHNGEDYGGDESLPKKVTANGQMEFNRDPVHPPNDAVFRRR